MAKKEELERRLSLVEQLLNYHHAEIAALWAEIDEDKAVADPKSALLDEISRFSVAAEIAGDGIDAEGIAHAAWMPESPAAQTAEEENAPAAQTPAEAAAAAAAAIAAPSTPPSPEPEPSVQPAPSAPAPAQTAPAADAYQAPAASGAQPAPAMQPAPAPAVQPAPQASAPQAADPAPYGAQPAPAPSFEPEAAAPSATADPAAQPTQMMPPASPQAPAPTTAPAAPASRFAGQNLGAAFAAITTADAHELAAEFLRRHPVDNGGNADLATALIEALVVNIAEEAPTASRTLDTLRSMAAQDDAQLQATFEPLAQGLHYDVASSAWVRSERSGAHPALAPWNMYISAGELPRMLAREAAENALKGE